MLEFSLPTNDILLSKIFSYLDNAKTTLNLQDYTISQTTLDQVFVNFASQESRDSLDKKRFETQLPYLNDLKSRISETHETKFNDSSKYDELALQQQSQNKSSNLLKSSPTYLTNQILNPISNQLIASQLSSHNKNNKNFKNKMNKQNFKTYMNHVNSQPPLKTNYCHLSNTPSTLYFNNHLNQPPPQPHQQQQLTNHLNNITYPTGNFLNTIARPSQSIFFNTAQPVHSVQPLIILPKAKRKK